MLVIPLHCTNDTMSRSPPSNEPILSSDSAQSGKDYWRFTDIGHVGEVSRDLSPHATDEVFNAASHLAATMLSLLGTVLLISKSSAQGDPWKIVSFSIYGASLVFLFGSSALHHSITASEAIEAKLRMLDYLAIYPLIAGTFTPLCIVFFHDDVIGWSFCGVVWFLAIVGIVATLFLAHKLPKWLTMTMYITLGWLGACMSYWLMQIIGFGGMALLVLGGLTYSVGGYIFYTEHPNPYPGTFGFHEIWHVLVVLAALFHWCLMYFYVLPWRKDVQ